LALALLLLYATSDEWSEFIKLAKDRDPDRRCEAVEKIRPRADLPMVQALLPLLADPHPRVRKRAAEAIARATSPPCVEYLAKTALKHPLKFVRMHAAGALGTIGVKSAAAALISSLADPDPEVRAAACEALAKIDATESTARLAVLAERDPAWLAKATALEALAILDPLATERLVPSAVADRAYQVRLTAARVGGLRAYAVAIADPDWRVRAQAIESACVLRDRAVIGPLVDLLGKEQGRLRWDAWLALRDLTGKELGLEPAHWKRWWDAQKDTFEIPPPRAPATERPGGETGVSFFSIPILSTRLSFVFDLSGRRDPAPKRDESSPVAKREAGKTFLQPRRRGSASCSSAATWRAGTRRTRRSGRSRSTPRRAPAAPRRRRT
jgi:HEAT repeat protein